MTILQDMIDEDFGIKGRGKWMHSIDHDSLVYNSEDDVFFWNSENIKGRALDYLIQVRGMKKVEAENFLKNYFGAFKEIKERGVVKPYDKLVDAMWSNGIDNRDYWYRRCLKDETIDRYKLGFYDGWNLIPIFEDGEFKNFQKRRDEPEKSIRFWYEAGKVYLFNEGVLRFSNTIYITEGLVDSILLNQEGLTSVSATGVNTWQNDWFVKFSRIQNIYYLADNDNAGKIGALKVAKSLGTQRVKIVTFDGKPDKYDTGDFFREYKSKDALLEWIETHNKYSFELDDSYKKKEYRKYYAYR